MTKVSDKAGIIQNIKQPMNTFYKSTLLATCLLLDATSFVMQADERDELQGQKAHLEAMKREVAEVRAKAAEFKEAERHEAAENAIRHAKELHQEFREQLARFEHQSKLKNRAKERLQASKEQLHAMEERLEGLKQRGKNEEAEALQDHIHKLSARLHKHGEIMESDREWHSDKHSHKMVRSNRENAPFKRDRDRHDRHENHHESGEISSEDHIHIAIEHLHAAGWHDVAEHLEREFHQRMEQHRHHEDNAANDHMREMMEHIENQFREVREQVEHLGQVLNESNHRWNNLEKRLRERRSKKD